MAQSALRPPQPPPLLSGKMAPQGQSVPCIPRENVRFLHYLMELRPKTCISLPFPSSSEGTPALNQGALLCSGKQACPSTWKQAPPWASHKIWHVGQPRLEPQAGSGPQPSSSAPGWPAASRESLREPGRPPQEENNRPVAPGRHPCPGPSKAGHSLPPIQAGPVPGATGRGSRTSVLELIVWSPLVISDVSITKCPFRGQGPGRAERARSERCQVASRETGLSPSR